MIRRIAPVWMTLILALLLSLTACQIGTTPSAQLTAPATTAMPATAQPATTVAESTAVTPTTEQPATTVVAPTAVTPSVEQPVTTGVTPTAVTPTTVQPATTVVAPTVVTPTTVQSATTVVAPTVVTPSTVRPATAATAPTAALTTAPTVEPTRQPTVAPTKKPAADKPRIGIAWVEPYKGASYPASVKHYAQAVIRAGGRVRYLPQVQNLAEAKAALKEVSGVILPGGGDIDPSYFGERPHPKLGSVEPARDRNDYWLIQAALNQDLPMLAVCRGIQVLNVVAGGTLYQDLPAQFNKKVTHRDPGQKVFTYHSIDIQPQSQLAGLLGTTKTRVNSWHHQGIKKLGRGLVATAVSPDGLVEAVEKPGARFLLGVQFHPEWHVTAGSSAHLNLFRALVDAAR